MDQLGLSQLILQEYADFVLQQDQSRYNVWKYCQYLEIAEADFYACYPSLQFVEKETWSALWQAAVDTAKEDAQYETFYPHQRLLTVLYVFFENLALNRSYILLSISGYNGQFEKLSLLSRLRRVFLDYVKETFADVVVDPKVHPLSPNDCLKMKGFQEGFWIQLVGLISFWRDDRSPQFESTDAAIEKSMRVATELIEKVPIDSLVDLGKFLFSNYFSR